MVRRILVLGSTGSVGRQALDVLTGLTSTHRVVGLSAHGSVARLAKQAAEHGPEVVCLADPAAEPGADWPAGTRVLRGPEGLVELVEATRPDVVVCAITGAAGLPSTLAAAERGGVVALANKESLVLAGHLVKAACARSGAVLVPVDSEHSAIAQCLAGESRAGVRRLVLTASGGPFRGRSAEELANVTVEQALRHPSWEMGPRITIDSATLMNKALEVIEACHLFDVGVDDIHVVVHPQSIIHSMVEFVDGALIAQLSPPDMRLPLRYALGFPERLASGAPAIDIARLGSLTFEEPDRQSFPCLALGEQVARDGGLAGTVLNAANEIAVEAFLARRIAFQDIPALVADALAAAPVQDAPDLATILDTDRAVRRRVSALLPQTAS